MSKLKLVNSPDNCGIINLAGWGVEGYYTCVSEMKKHNRSKADMVLAGGAVALGQPFEVGEAVDFTGAPTGEGYFRKITVEVDFSEFEMSIKNNGGSTSVDGKKKIRIGGFSAENIDFHLRLMSCCGLSFITPDKNGQYWELGNKLSPARMTDAKIINKKDGAYIEAEIMLSYPPRKYDVVAFPIDEVPN